MPRTRPRQLSPPRSGRLRARFATLLPSTPPYRVCSNRMVEGEGAATHGCLPGLEIMHML